MFVTVGGMVLKQKNKFFSFQKHYLFLIFLSLFGGEIGRCPGHAMSWVTMAALLPKGPAEWAQQPHSSRPSQETVHLWGLLSLAHSQGDPRDPRRPGLGCKLCEGLS
jgi:hypothetical protein